MLFIGGTEYLKNVDENVANVQVELESGVGIVLLGILKSLAADDHLCVDGKENRHDNGAETTVHGLQDVVAHEYASDAEAQEREHETDCD